MVIRHLIYHVTPLGNYKENIKEIVHRWHIFNGSKTVAVAKGPNLEAIEHVKKLFPLEDKDLKFLHIDNHPLLRETVTFVPLLTELQRNCNTLYRDGKNITFYGHTKGVTHTANKAVRLWTRGCYVFNLDDVREAERLLTWFPIVGSFKRYMYQANFPKGSHNWHYSGTFFWFDNKKLFAKDWKKAIHSHRYGVEVFPSMLFLPTEGGVIFGDGIGDMYNLIYVRDLYKKHNISWAM